MATHWGWHPPSLTCAPEPWRRSKLPAVTFQLWRGTAADKPGGSKKPCFANRLFSQYNNG